MKIQGLDPTSQLDVQIFQFGQQSGGGGEFGAGPIQDGDVDGMPDEFEQYQDDLGADMSALDEEDPWLIDGFVDDVDWQPETAGTGDDYAFYGGDAYVDGDVEAEPEDSGEWQAPEEDQDSDGLGALEPQESYQDGDDQVTVYAPAVQFVGAGQSVPTQITRVSRDRVEIETSFPDGSRRLRVYFTTSVRAPDGSRLGQRFTLRGSPSTGRYARQVTVSSYDRFGRLTGRTDESFEVDPENQVVIRRFTSDLFARDGAGALTRIDRTTTVWLGQNAHEPETTVVQAGDAGFSDPTPQDREGAPGRQPEEQPVW